MKKLLLTSNGFENSNIGKEFLKMVGKIPEKIKVLFIPTAARTKEELYYAEESKKELLDLGIKKKKIIDYNLDREISEEEIKDFDVIYVCGGNTFYLLHKIRESKFDEKIKEMVEKGVVYVGASAGSVLTGPDISIAGADDSWDENDVNIKDTSGLNLTDKIISSHYVDKEEEIIEQFEKETGKQVTRLKNNQALLVLGDEVEIIS